MTGIDQEPLETSIRPIESRAVAELPIRLSEAGAAQPVHRLYNTARFNFRFSDEELKDLAEFILSL